MASGVEPGQAVQGRLGPGDFHAGLGAGADQVGFDYVDSRGLSSRMTGRKEPFAMVEL